MESNIIRIPLRTFRYAFYIELKDGYDYSAIDYSEVIGHLGSYIGLADAIVKVLDGRVIVLEYTKQKRLTNVEVNMSACTLKKIRVRECINYIPSSI